MKALDEKVMYILLTVALLSFITGYMFGNWFTEIEYEASDRRKAETTFSAF